MIHQNKDIQEQIMAALEEKAEGGDLEAIFQLGWHYLYGKGVVQNIERGSALLQQAAERETKRPSCFPGSQR